MRSLLIKYVTRAIGQAYKLSGEYHNAVALAMNDSLLCSQLKAAGDIPPDYAF
jgi:hypothetical protein